VWRLLAALQLSSRTSVVDEVSLSEAIAALKAIQNVRGALEFLADLRSRVNLIFQDQSTT